MSPSRSPTPLKMSVTTRQDFINFQRSDMIPIYIYTPSGNTVSLQVHTVPRIGETCTFLGHSYRITKVHHNLQEAEYGLPSRSTIDVYLGLP